MDGTLVDTGSVITNTINYVRKNIGLEEMERTYLLENVNNPHINSAEFFYGTKEFTDKQSKLFEEYYHEHCIVDTVLYDGVKEMLIEFEEIFNLAVATNSFDIFVHKILDHLGIKNHFGMVIGANNVEKAKPHPDMVLEVMKTYNGIDKKEDFILIGDSYKDKMAAESAQIEFLMVEWGFTRHDNAILSVDELKEKILNYLI